MFGYIEELEEEIFKELEDAEFVEIKKAKGFSSKEEEDAFVEDFLKRMDAIDAEYDEKANEDDNFEESHMCKVLKEWLNTSTFEDDIIEEIDDDEYTLTEFDEKLMEWVKTDECFELEGSLIEHLEKEDL